MVRVATTKQVAAALGVKETTVQLYSREGRIPFDRTPGGHRRYDVTEVQDVLAHEEPRVRVAVFAPASRLGAGVPVRRSAMAAMDAERRAVKGERLEPAGRREASRSAAVGLIEHSRRVLVAV